jgi:hypothetical protein
MRGDLSWFSNILGPKGKHSDLVESYRNRAEELRVKAEAMRDQMARAAVLRVAADYDRRAEMLERANSDLIE